VSSSVSFLEILWMFQDVSLKVKSSVKEGFPEYHIQRIKKIFDGEKGAIKKPFAPGGTHGDEKPFPLGFPFAEWDLIDPVLLDPE